MYKSFSIENFRCFETFKIDGFKRINLFSGPNNVGKTALLEALFLYCGAHNPNLALHLDANRGMDFLEIRQGSEAPWASLFYEYNTSKEIRLEGIDEKKVKDTFKISVLEKLNSKISDITEENKSHNLTSEVGFTPILKLIYRKAKIETKYEISVDSTGFHIEPSLRGTGLPVFFHSSKVKSSFKEYAERFGTMELQERQNIFLNAMKIIEPRIKKIKTIVIYGVPILHCDIGLARPIPIYLLGEGMVLIGNRLLFIANAPNGVVLIDEIENGVHYSILEKYWEALYKFVHEYNTQIFATTHSFECIKAAHKVFSKARKYDFMFTRLERKNGAIVPIIYDKKTLATSIKYGFEVR